MRLKNAFAGLLLGLVMAAGNAYASFIFVTPAGSTVGGQPVDAQAQFTFGAGTLTIVLTNLEANPTSVIQALSDLEFTLGTAASTSSLTSSSGTERTIAGDGTFTDGSTVSTGWALSGGGTAFKLDVLGTLIGPAHLLIGPAGPGGTYSNANGSIAGNKPHNPFLDAGPATFQLALGGVTDNTTITSVTFSFGTTEGDVGSTVPGVPIPSEIPEPDSLALLGFAALLMAFAIRRRRVG